MKNNTYSIGTVARKTGLSTHAIRVWERRYQAVLPKRTEGHQRQYDEEDLQKLSYLKTLTDNGFRIRHLAKKIIQNC